jgi:hypothetical protein
MKLWSDFEEMILVDVPGCPSVAVELAVKNTVIEFCEKTLIHQVTLDPITLRAGVLDYDLDVPTGYRLQKIMKVFFQGKPIDAVAPDSINVPDAYAARIGGYTPGRSGPVAYTQKDLSTVSFLPIADQTYANAVTIRAALSPLRDSTGCEDFLYENWGEFIACGAKARLMMTPSKPYTNLDAASINQGRYNSAINDARQRANRGNVRSDLRVQLRKI